VRVILVDDAVLVREGIARLLTDSGLRVVAQLGDAADLLPAVARHRPAVVVLDVRMPPTHTVEGLVAAAALKRAHPDVGVLLLSQHLESRYAVELLQSGHGVGYLLKERVARPAELVDAIRRVGEGGSVVDPEVVRTVLATRRTTDPLAHLSARERAVLELVAEGLSNQAIAARLVLTDRTVEAHVRSLLTKLNLPFDAGTHRRVLAVLAHLRARTPAIGD
jgi:DNA-binding NarL/FixJ family response regulator